MSYRVFVRNWWKPNHTWPDGREPHMGKKKYIGRVDTEAEARDMCREYNATHNPGKWSRKAEYESA